jgi:hypothetical protein
MSPAWWEMPTRPIDGLNQASALEFERLMCQVWHFELEMQVHLPFMLRAATDRRYEYSRISCLRASRDLIRRWMVMRDIHGPTFVSNLVEFQAFTAAITILLGLLGPAHSTTTTTTVPAIVKERDADLQLMETVVQVLEGRKEYSTSEHIVSQSISVIRTLLGILRNEGNPTAHLRLEIPHFGTISVARDGTVQSLTGERILGSHSRSEVMSSSSSLAAAAETNSLLHDCRSNPITSTYATGAGNSAWESMSVPASQGGAGGYQSHNADGDFAMDGDARSMRSTVLQFTSSQFPMFETPVMDNNAAEWLFEEDDVMIFDSLLNADVGSHWDI